MKCPKGCDTELAVVKSERIAGIVDCCEQCPLCGYTRNYVETETPESVE